MSEALRFNEGKPSLAYILQFKNPIKAIARIMEFGATKYADGNWRKGGKPDREYLDSMMRHLTDWVHGKKYDKDSGCSHLGHAIWNLMALHELNHPDEIIDDEVFKRQCAFWKAKKEEVIPAEPDEVPLQKNTVVMEIPAASRPEEGRQKGEPPKCPECGSPTSSFGVSGTCPCGWWNHHADSCLTKSTGGEEQKEEEPEDDIEISFTFPTGARCESFEALVKKLMSQDMEVKLRDAFFKYLANTPEFPQLPRSAQHPEGNK